MPDQPDVDTAWNRMVMEADPAAHAPGSALRAAALASVYMSEANSGGINSFLTSRYDLDASEVQDAMQSIGATAAAMQLQGVLNALPALPVQSEADRWDLMEQHWTDALDQADTLSEEANASLIAALEAHVRQHAGHYLSLRP